MKLVWSLEEYRRPAAPRLTSELPYVSEMTTDAPHGLSMRAFITGALFSCKVRLQQASAAYGPSNQYSFSNLGSHGQLANPCYVLKSVSLAEDHVWALESHTVVILDRSSFLRVRPRNWS